MSRPADTTLLQASPADRWVGRVAGGTVTALAALAGAISYSHMRQLAWQHGQAGWHAHAFPLSVDGLEIVASLVLLAGRRSGRRTGWLPWAALVLGTAGSLAANIATARPDMLSRIIAGWPALALLMCVKLLAGILERPATGDHPALPAPALISTDPDAAIRQTAGSRRPSTAPAAAGQVPAQTRPGTVPDLDFAVLLPAARAVRDELVRDGQALTRDTLAIRLREQGHQIRNSRLTLVLRALRDDPASQPAPRTRQSAAA